MDYLSDENIEGIEQNNIMYKGSKSPLELKTIIEELCDEYGCNFYSNDFDAYDDNHQMTMDENYRSIKDGFYYICYKMSKDNLILMKGGIDEEDYDEDSHEINKFHVDLMPCPERWGTYNINLGVNDEFYYKKNKRYDDVIDEKIRIHANDCYCAFDDMIAAKNFLALIVPEEYIGVSSRLNPPSFVLSEDMFL